MKVGENISMNLTLTTDEFVYQVKKSNELLKELRTSLVQTAESTKKVESNINGLSTGFRHFMQMAATARFAMLDFYDVFLKLPMSIIKTSGEMERMLKLMEGLSTASDKLADAKRSQAFVFGMAQNAPYDVKTLTDSFVKLKSGGIDPTNGSMQALVDSVAKFGGTSEQLHRASIAIQQMGGKGVISMEELRQQLGEAVPNAINMMAIGVGKSMSDLTKAISNGEVESKSALERMFAVMAVQNHGAANTMMDTWVGMIEQLKTKWLLFQNVVGGGAAGKGVFSEARKEVESLLNSFDGEVARKFGVDLSEGLYEFARVIRGVIQSVVTYYEEIKTFGEALLVLFAANKAAGFVTAVKGSLVALGAAYKANAVAFAEAEAEKTANAIKFTETQAIQAMMSKTLMQEEIAAKRAQVAALRVQHAEAMASYVAHNAIVRSGMIGNWVVEAETRAASAALAAQALETAEAIAIESRAIQSQSAVLAQNIVETNALIAGKAKLAAEMTAVGNAAVRTGAKMAGMGGVFTALGGWMTVLTAGIMAAVWAWDKFGNAAEKNAERARRAANKMSTVEDVNAAKASIANLEQQFRDDEKLGPQQRMSKDGEPYKKKMALLEQRKKDLAIYQDNLNQNAAADAVRSQERSDEYILKGSTASIDKLISGLDETYQKQKDAISNNKALSQSARAKQIAELDKGRGEGKKKYGAEIANTEIAHYKSQIAEANAKLVGASDEEKIKLDAIISSLEEKRKSSVQKLAKNGLIGTDHEHMKSKSSGSSPSSGSSGTAVGSYVKYLEDAERDLKNAGSKQSQILGEISKTQEIENEVRAKFEALLDEKKLTKITKNAKGKSVVTPMDASNEADRQKIEYLIRVAAQAQKAKFALGDLKKEESALKIEQEEFNQLLDAGGSASEYASQKVEKLSAEYSNMQKELLLDCENLKAVNDALDAHAKRLMIAAEANNFAYGKKSKKELDNAELDAITDSQEKIRRQYELTTFAIGEEYAKRVSDTAKVADIEIERGILTEVEKQERILGVVKSYQMQQQAALLNFQKASKTPMDNLAAQWEDTTSSMNKASVGWSQGFMDELTKLMTTGKADWKKFILGMATDVTRMSLEKAFGGMITKGFSGIGGGILGLLNGGKANGLGILGTNAGSQQNSLLEAQNGVFGKDTGGSDVTEQLSTFVDEMKTKVGSMFDGLGTSLSEMGSSITEMLPSLDGVMSGLGDMGSSLMDMVSGPISSLSSALWDQIAAIFQNIFAEESETIANEAAAISESFAANGAYFDGSFSAFAKGGTFTNGIVNKPTPFRFGKGGKFGLMGEAGPEAIMPLSRDGSGRLGVMVTGQNDSSNSTYDNSGANQQVNINIVINKEGGGDSKNSSGDEKGMWGKMAERVKGVVKEEISTQQRPGGLLYK